MEPTNGTSSRGMYGGNKYESFKQQRQTLASLIDQQTDVLKGLDMATWVEAMNKLKERILTDDFKVLVIGQFNGGKSTLINALLKEDVLPSDPRPYTAVISEVKWGDRRKAVVHFRNENGSPRPPQEVGVAELDGYLAVNYEEWHADAKKQIRESPYDHVELYWDLELCRNGVELIDSPGLNANEVHQKITMDYLGSVDAVLFILSCEALASKYEMDIVTNVLKPAGYEDIFFICNRINQLRPKDQQKIRDFGRALLAPHTSGGAEHVFFVNALGAVEGYENNDTALIAESGVPPLETALETFLAKEKGRVKITRASRELHTSIYEARKMIPEREAMLNTDLETLEQRYAEAQEPLEHLETERQQIMERTALIHSDVRHRSESKVEALYQVLANKVYDWIQEYEVTQPFTRGELRNQERRDQAIERVSTEVGEYVAQQLDVAVREWQQTELQPLLEEGTQKLQDYLDSSTEDFLNHLEEVRVQVAHGTSVEQPAGVPGKDIPATERVLAGIGGLIAGGPGMAYAGAAFGYQELGRTLAPQLGLFVGTALLIGINPLTVIPGIIYTIWRLGKIAETATQQIKEQVAHQYADNIRSEAREAAKTVSEEIGKAFSVLEEAIQEGLSAQIQSLREQVESVLEEKRQGRGKIDQARQELSAADKQLLEIDQKLDELMSEVAIG